MQLGGVGSFMVVNCIVTIVSVTLHGVTLWQVGIKRARVRRCSETARSRTEMCETRVQ